MKGDLVLADSQLQAKIMSVVDAEPAPDVAQRSR